MAHERLGLARAWVRLPIAAVLPFGFSTWFELRVWNTACTPVAFPGLTFVLVMVPAPPGGSWFQPHDDAWVRIANVAPHGVAFGAGICLVVASMRAVPYHFLNPHVAPGG